MNPDRAVTAHHLAALETALATVRTLKAEIRTQFDMLIAATAPQVYRACDVLPGGSALDATAMKAIIEDALEDGFYEAMIRLETSIDEGKRELGE